ncbi:DUF3710 domain-containing protein [Pseudofrankia asymbiotica]|uniref:Uncharacterized protein n=1 Tax=Pseudofrankia asymbiotica TaxID=1834516 RepID=A0A1V2I5E3_9ACTN|nr:DUF3710 domain-containing protein [Pseudofrankia asymbiotica]ONH26037.1 hypothetical protein BL253_25810 [Pseudofrankia asymbiotica]
MFRWVWSRWSRRAGPGEGLFGAGLGPRDGELVELEVNDLTPGGPYDLGLAPSDGVRRLDLGALLVPLLDGVDYRLRLDGERVSAVVALAGRSAMELTALAAPKSQGIWDDIRAEIWLAAALPGSAGNRPPPAMPALAGPALTGPVWVGGPVEVAAGHGRFGPELLLVPTAPAAPPEAPPAESSGDLDLAASGVPGPFTDLGVVSGPSALSGLAGPVRLVGVDGPRWFLQAAVTGPAAAPRDESLMDDVLRGTIVIRGGRAMPVRASLPLRLPTDTEDPAGPDDLVDPMAADPDGPPLPGRHAGQPAAWRAAARGPVSPTDLESLRPKPTGASSADPRRISYGLVPPPSGGLGRNLMTWG